MKRISLLFAILSILVSLAAPRAAHADTSHVRIVRLSIVQGDVRFASDFHNDPLSDPKATWQTAPLNLPLRDGNALSTGGKGRAEVEFENGAMAFLDNDTVVEFYDLSLNDGDRITRLVLRQGSASFSVSEQHHDYFSVTGGDFTVEVDGTATFRLGNFDNGSTVDVIRGHVNILQNEKTTPLVKGQSFTVHASDPGSPEIARATPGDDFDKWVSSHIQYTEASFVNGNTNTATGYTGYAAGYSDLYSYGSWFSVNGFNCWRPFGMGFGWSPFDYGSWYMDGAFGWSFIGSAPWGWLPYHYGGWLFSPSYGWLWTPGMGGALGYRPVTAVWIHSGNALALVPANPADKSGKIPMNMTHGIYTVQGGTVARNMTAAGDQKWTVVKGPPRDSFASTVPASAPPARVARNLAVNTGAMSANLSHGSSIVYDPVEHRFVNSAQVSARGANFNSISTHREIGVPPGEHASKTSTVARGNVSRQFAVPSSPRIANYSGNHSGSSSSPTFFPGSSAGPFAGSSSGSSSHPSSGGGRPH